MVEATSKFKMILSDTWPTSIFEVVGEISIAFAQMEHILWLSPKRLQKMDYDKWEAMAKELWIPQRCQQIEEAYAIRGMNQAKEGELAALMKEVKRVNNERVKVVHSRWGVKKDNGKVISRHRIWKGKELGVELEPLITLRNDIRAVRDKLHHFKW